MQCTAPLKQAVVNGACGPASGVYADNAPATGLCAAGTVSAVAGNNPWSWSCAGANGGIAAQCMTTAAPPTSGACIGSAFNLAQSGVLLPPSVPQASSANDIVGVVIQNTNMSTTHAKIITFGQVFRKGQVLPTDKLVARIYGTAHQVQMDSQALWADGSVKMAAMTVSADICPGTEAPALLSKATPNDPAFNTAPVSLPWRRSILRSRSISQAASTAACRISIWVRR